uniref:Uncharacterized protein n=1 Tax=Brassica oleracea TaxID=3712 RepID=A0A3P6EEN4_BRAOL|nr:unnamed protein product [Brassica oleracea]
MMRRSSFASSQTETTRMGINEVSLKTVNIHHAVELKKKQMCGLRSTFQELRCRKYLILFEITLSRGLNIPQVS